MLFIKYFFYVFVLHLVTAKFQINLHRTEWINDNSNDASLRHNCLYVDHSIEKSSSYEISSYCLSESTSEWNIPINNLDRRFTFNELRQSNITNKQLYDWSAPIDTIERYELYLSSYSNSNVSSILGRYIFYNCTFPYFGRFCEYSLNIDKDNNLSLKEMINNYYNQLNQVETLTCYINLKCKRGPSSLCLDWSEICDGKVDCNDGIDEKYCSTLKINQCKSNEYRCDNGQCIPQTFANDNFNTFDCLDRSDEYENLSLPSRYQSNKPTIENEDMICSWRGQHMNNYLTNFWTSSCQNQRHSIIQQNIFSETSPSTSDNCILAFKCHLNIPTPNNPSCSNICQNEICINIIENTCPNMFFYPNSPIAFGHIYFAYTKQYVMNSITKIRTPPEYICYNEQLCDGFYSNRTLLSFSGKTCRYVKDFPIYFNDNGINPYMNFIESIYVQLSHCNAILNDNSMISNSSLMYQCKNSLKSIPYSSVGDGILDCDYHDDEEQTIINQICLLDQSNHIFFRCQTEENKCIHRNKIEDGICDCQQDENYCDDENIQLNKIKHKIQFSTMCDGFIDLLPIIINQTNQTDETDCQYWPCNNIYTRCNGIWNCPDGSDEVDCPSSSSICSPYRHMCVSNQTNQFMCLPLTKANDGIIDCLGATDEPNLCPVTNRYDQKKFYCRSNDGGQCLSTAYLCDGIVDCIDGDDEQFCDNDFNIITVFENLFDTNLNNNIQLKILSDKSKQNAMKSDKSMTRQFQSHCNRGIPLRIRLDTTRNLTRTGCLCPSNYYGDQCQYQNERVSLTLQLDTTSNSQQIPFILVISLIDNTIQRIIHSSEQITYLHTKDQHMKYNIHLLYSTRPKDLSKQYSIHINIYERLTLSYRGSLFLPIQFPFLPVQRIAVKLNIPNRIIINETCNNQQCIHGRCRRYLNEPTITFCQCNQGWSGRYCDIPYISTCSADSLCLGLDANNRSICVCPINKFGSQCFLNNNICQSGSTEKCLNGGYCIPSDEFTTSSYKFVCLCQKGFTGNRCEIPDTKMIVSFDKQLVLPSRTLIFFHLIRLINNTLSIHNKNPTIICDNETSIINYASNPFNITFIELFPFAYYLTFIQNTSYQSLTIQQTITPKHRCRTINEIFNQTIIQMHSLQRLKYYHLPCQNSSLDLTCFYDITHMCLCQTNSYQRSANCFEFNHQLKIDDIDSYYQKIEFQCTQKYLFNSSTSFSTSIQTTSPSRSTRTTTRTNGTPSIHVSQYFLFLLILLFCFI